MRTAIPSYSSETTIPRSASRVLRSPGSKRALACTPRNFLQFATCEDVPLVPRRCIAVAIYLMPRLGELERLHCEDIDLEHERVTIRRSWDRARKREKAPKDMDPRTFDIHPNVLPLLRVMIAEANGTGLLLPIRAYNIAPFFSEYLDRAK